MITQCVVLCGGLGTRLGDLTREIPKPLLPIAGRPFLDAIQQKALEHGYTSMLLLAGYQSRHIIRYAKERALPGMNIAVITEDRPMGTAGALRLALPRLEERFLLVNGDSLFDFDWRSMLSAPLMTMALIRTNNTSRYNAVRLENGKVTEFGEGISPYMNGGVYLMDRRIAAGLPERGSLEKDIFPDLARSGLMRGEIHEGFFLDIGIPEAYESAQSLIPDIMRWTG